jgi:hypothetical protein
MIFGANNQNKTLANSAKDRPPSAAKTITGNKMAARIATSKQSSTASAAASGQDQVASGTSSELRSAPSDLVMGSSEGLMHAPSTVIQPSGAGYDNKSIQTARFKPKETFQGLNIKNSFTGFKKGGNIQRYGSITAVNSSAHKMNSKLEVERFLR